MEEVYHNASELHCSPRRAHAFAEKNSTCFNHKELKLLAGEFNKRRPRSEHIKGRTKKELVEQLLVAYKHICDKHQFCWIKQTMTDPEKIAKLEKAFRPKKPESWDENHNTWLNTLDIMYVMEQYEGLHKDYAFLGVFPIDFAEHDTFGKCIGDVMCNLDVRKFDKKRFAIVFNTDPSYKGGQHWICVFCDLRPKSKNYGIYYYDSVANAPPREITEFMARTVDQVGDIKFKAYENKVQRQFSNYDCGVFVQVFITQMLKNIHKFKYVCEHMHKDKEINKIRDVLYRPNLKTH